MMKSAESIIPVILAAGNSKRMGYPKALLPLGEEVFLTRILRVLREAGLARPRLILGRDAALVEARIGDYPVDIHVNPDPDRGQLSSIQLGVSGFPEKFEAAMLWPVDQPAVSVELTRRLTELFVAKDCRIAVPFRNGKRGHPAIFHRTLFHEFMDAPMGKGAKGIISRYESETCFLPSDESAAFIDIDTPSDYQTLTGQRLEEAIGPPQGGQ
ncbi:MAG: nucleotidyltransferase family protein [Acidobacteriota bacterium]|jgi:molybdenum cofactor cytidylyltransferase|nr:nucleotidyltransferase family protein [Acidobacteriota bacterium]